MVIYLGTDHAGFTLKESIKRWLRELGYTVHDEGAFHLDPEDDYPDFIHIVAKEVASDPSARGILFGASGQGEAMVANRYRGVRAAVFSGQPLDQFKRCRTDNDANVIALAAGFISTEDAQRAIHAWLTTPFSGEPRHRRRLAKLDSAETAAGLL